MKIVLQLLVTGLFTLDYLSSLEIIPRGATWLIEVIIIFLALKMFFFKKDLIFIGAGRIVDFFFVTLIFVSFLSVILNTIHPISYMIGMRAYVKYVFLFYVLINLNIPTSLMRRVFGLFWLFVSLQPVASFLQWTKFGFLQPDLNGGTMAVAHGGTAILGVITGMYVSLGLSFYLEMRSKKYLFPIIGLLLALGLADAKTGFIFVLIAALTVLTYRALCLRPRLLLKKFIILISIIGICLYATVEVASKRLNVDLVELALDAKWAWTILTEIDITEQIEGARPTIEDVEYFQLHISYLSRIFNTQYALKYMDRLAGYGLLGAGPGATNPSFVEAFSGQVYKYHTRIYGTEISVFWTQFSSIIVDWGYIGFVVFIGLYCAVFLINTQFYNQCQDSYWRSVSLSLTGSIVVLLSSIFYQKVMIEDVLGFSVWFTFAMIITKRKEDQRRIADLGDRLEKV